MSNQSIKELKTETNKKQGFNQTFAYKLIYVFSIPNKEHEGVLKVGDTTIETNKPYTELLPNCSELNKAAKERIDSYTQTPGIRYNLLHTEIAVFEKDGKAQAFKRDHDVHSVLKNSGYMRKTISGTTGREWYNADLETIKNAIKAVKEGRNTLKADEKSTDKTPIDFRPEQKEAIKKANGIFRGKNDWKRMLWNAKMRFGKTLCALQVIKENKFKKTLILTHRPVVDIGWHEDFDKIFYDTDYVYYQIGNKEKIIESSSKGDPFVYFASLQDLRGSEKVGGKFNKNDEIFDIEWDCVIIDEAHEGTTTELGENVKQEVVSSKTCLLELSGTPFNILNKYDDKTIYTWDYIMEQRCKNEWDELHFGDTNPYADLPKMNIFTYNLGKLLSENYVDDIEDKAFNFKEFFRTWTGEKARDHKPVPAGAKIGDFVHENDVKSFLNLLVKEDTETNYPFATEEYRDLFKHSLWIIPGVREARALAELLRSHPVFQHFEIINVAGDGDEWDTEADIAKVKNGIKNNDYSITLSCGKLTTGTTIPEWTAAFMLYGSYTTAASRYLQTIFRVQSSANIDGKIKKNCYVFDFAPDRTLKMLADAVSLSTKPGIKQDKNEMREFINYCPVISCDGSQMAEYDVDSMMQQLKHAYVDRAINTGFDDPKIYNDELLKLDELDLQKFKELEGIIGKSKQAKKINEIDINAQGLTDEEIEALENGKKNKKKELTEEQKKKLEELNKARKQKADAISILRGISIRIPLMVYGADISLDEDISIEDLPKIVDDTSWEEFMPKGVTKEKFNEFTKYYDNDIFTGATRRIREIAKAADKLEPTERTQRIADLFLKFKNPDKETVLTPWRVVNMHMSDTLGGYCFYDEGFENIITDSEGLAEPRFVDQGDVTEDTLGNVNAKILEINSKTGLYPLYVTYSIYRKRCEKYPNEELTDELKIKLWDKTVKENVFVICKTQMAKKITQRTLCGYRNTKINAHYFEDLINMLKNKLEHFINKVTKKTYWNKGGNEDMKFNAVVGNPPYQENVEKRGEQPPVYHFFYDAASCLTTYVSLITPARFLFNAGKTPESWNNKMLNSPHFQVCHYFEDASDVFPNNVEIKGGIAITAINKKKESDPIIEFSKFEELDGIIYKVKRDEGNFEKIFYSNTSYKYNRSFFEENNGFEDRVSGGSLRYLSSSVFNKFPEVFFEEKPLGDTSYAKILGRFNNETTFRFIKEKYLNPPDNYKYYKVFLAGSSGTGKFGEKLREPIIGCPNDGATETFLSLGKFESRSEAENVKKYLKTKFARTLLGVKKVTQGCKNGKLWRQLVLQDFSNSSDIDWSKSISEIDQQLYKKYGLSQDEIDFIESKVQEMR